MNMLVIQTIALYFFPFLFTFSLLFFIISKLLIGGNIVTFQRKKFVILYSKPKKVTLLVYIWFIMIYLNA